MDAVITTIFEFGIFGNSVTKLSEHELELVIFHPSIEIIEDLTRQKLLEKFTIESFSECTSQILKREKIIQNKVKLKQKMKSKSKPNKNCNLNLNLKAKLDKYYIKLNSIHWKQMAIGNLYDFRKVQYFYVLNKLVINDFVKYDEMYKESKITNNILEKFFEKMVNINYFECKIEDNVKYYRIKRVNGKIKHPKIVKVQPIVLDIDEDKMIKKIMHELKINVDGISVNDIAERIKLTAKQALRLAQKLCKNNEDFIFIREVEGKVSRYRFFSAVNYQKYRSKPDNTGQKNIIMRSDKIKILQDFINEKKPFIISRQITIEYSKRIKSQFIPDNKNFKKLVKEAGYKIVTANYFSNNISKFIVCDIETDDSTVINRFKPKYIYKMEEKGSKFDIIFQNFVAYKKFIEQDNGYVEDVNIRLNNFVTFLMRNMDEKNNLIFDKTFIYNIALKDIFTFLPYHFYLKEREEIINDEVSLYLYETDDMRVEGVDILSSSTFWELINKEYKNIDYLKLKNILILYNFKFYFDNLAESGYKIEKTDKSYIINFDHRYEISVQKSSINSYVSLDKRMKFYNNIMNTDISQIVKKIESQLELIDDVNEYNTFKQRFIQFKKNYKNLNTNKSGNCISEYKDKFYIELKEKIMQEKVIKISSLENINTVLLQKTIKSLKAIGIMKENLEEKNLYFDEEYMNNFACLNMQSIFPMEFFWLNLKEESNFYLSCHYKLIVFQLTLNGTHEVKKLVKKIKIIDISELYYIMDKFKDDFLIENINNVEYITFVFKNIFGDNN